MAELIYETQMIGFSSEPKPMAMENRSFPYNGISDRRFEELLFSVVKVTLDQQPFRDFDKIALLNGVREKGRDCVLYRNNKQYGLIQCKKYDQLLSISMLGAEIIKFVLYSIKYPELIHDRNDFTYFIAVSKGFANECHDFINNFNDRILNEPRLAKWLSDHLASGSLSSLELRECQGDIDEILSKIKVRPILPQDIDLLLSMPQASHLVPLFFQVKVIEIPVGASSLPNNTSEVLGRERLLQELGRASVALRSEANEFDDIPDSHIWRNETDRLLKWINAPKDLDKKDRPMNICLLAGNAGMGKTVILKDLYESLHEQELPVLALKADKLYTGTIQDLQQKLHLSVPVFDFLDQCAANFEKTILLIDQIDALSQSMSSDPIYLQVLREVIDTFGYSDSFDIVISVRIFDLHHDPNLRAYRQKHSVLVEKLGKEQVLEQLQKIGIEQSTISGKLLDLLCTPNNLNVYARIAGQVQSSAAISTLLGLYTELWKQKLIFVPPQTMVAQIRVRELLYRMANDMFSFQRISLSEIGYQDMARELDYVKSHRLVRSEAGQLQFFHQTFYDYVFAKCFVEQDGDLPTYIVSQGQSLFIRSAVSMIISYLREFDFNRYIGLLKHLFGDTKTAFHIKHLLVSLLAYQEQPTSAEFQLMAQVAGKSVVLSTLFLLKAGAGPWFDFARQNGLLAIPGSADDTAVMDVVMPDDEGTKLAYLDYRRNVLSLFVARNLGDRDANAWRFLHQIVDANVLWHVALYLLDWGTPQAKQFAERLGGLRPKDVNVYGHVLEQLLHSAPEFVFNKMLDELREDTTEDKSAANRYRDGTLMEKLIGIIPGKMIDGLFAMILPRIIGDAYDSGSALKKDYTFSAVLLYDEHLYGREYLYRILAQCLKNAAGKQDPAFYRFLQLNGRSVYKSVLRLLIFAMKDHHAIYVHEILGMFNYLMDHDALPAGSDFAGEFRSLFALAFPQMSADQQQGAVERIMAMVIPHESYVYRHGDVPQRVTSVGLGKFVMLQLLPSGYVSARPQLKRTFAELKRRFPSYHELPVSSVTAGIVQNPIPQQSAEKMTNQQWIESFRTYNSDERNSRRHFLKGGLFEHANAFHDIVKRVPSTEKVELISIAIATADIDPTYPIHGLLGLTKAGYDPLVVFSLFKRILLELEYSADTMPCILIAGYLVRQARVDIEVIDFLLAQTVVIPGQQRVLASYPVGETSINGLVTMGINSYHGSAIHELTLLRDSRYLDRIMVRLEEIFKEGPDESKACALFEFAQLNHLDTDRAFALFARALNAEENIHVLAAGIWSLQYMSNHDFSQLRPMLEKLVSADNLGREDADRLSGIILVHYLKDSQGADMLLFTLMEHSPGACTAILRNLVKFYNNPKYSKEQMNTVLVRLAALGDLSPDSKFRIRFNDMGAIMLSDIETFLDAYVGGDNFMLTEDFVSYLRDSTVVAPKKCATIFLRAFATGRRAPRLGREILNDEVTRLIVACLRLINGNDPQSETLRRELMAAFDLLLRDFRYRVNTDRIFEELSD
ncbi:ATP-binding protein [Terrimonas sp. NA20]|uniref:ATP-binding protein n=1 Tax=Terrimonas ginsenosidimutans TaxID=2908004 RepID=A0ABS9KSF4_9BACT|nr:ATP-binding protein [Terrimonas ginsenosidimutans]MCG2615261.1 ATP-binding protein [Terrimonas ginsenosidimutans]